VLATRRWAVQGERLEEEDLWMMYQVAKAFGRNKEGEREVLGFYK